MNVISLTSARLAGTMCPFSAELARPETPLSAFPGGQLLLDTEASARLRYLGAYALVPDNSQRATPETDLNLRGAYTIGHVQIYGELLSALDERGKDIVYWYPAYVAGVDPPGLTSADIDCGTTNCRMSRAEEPRTLRLGVKIRF